METVSQNCCRACLETQHANMKTLDEMWGSGLTFLNLFESLLGTKNSEDFSKFLCTLCEKRLVDAYLFKEQCLVSEKVLLAREVKAEEVANDSTFAEGSQGEDHSCTDSLGKVYFEEHSEEGIPLDSSEIQVADDNHFSLNSSENFGENQVERDVPKLRYSCLKCAIKFASYQEYQSHYREHHRQKHVCSECGKLVARHNLEKHQLCHSRPEHVCEACGRAFTLRENLAKHIRIHMRDHRYECEYCGKMFIHWNSKRCHVISQHTKEKKYECTFCNKRFAHSSNMLRHVRYHTGEMTHSCSYCSKEFNTTSELKNHIVTHTKEKNEVCEICNKAFGTRKGLRNHLKTHTGERDYVCPVCSKAFTQPHVLRTHLKSHPDYPMPPPGAILSKKRLEREFKEEKLEDTANKTNPN